MLIQVFARVEPTRDPTVLALAKAEGRRVSARQTDVAIYRDKGCTQPFARYPTYASSRPRKSTRVVRLNCYQWRVEWLPRQQ